VSRDRYLRQCVFFLLVALSVVPQAQARMVLAPDAFASGFVALPLVSPANFARSIIAKGHDSTLVNGLCAELSTQFGNYPWERDACGKVPWQADLISTNGRPLIYTVFGSGEETTLLLGGVHPDELTPIPIAFRVARFLHEHPEVLAPNSRVILAPLVNPDGFFRKKPSRTNHNGVDLNRNFFTMDWYEKARQLWIERRSRLSSHFPGHFPNSEIETIFQIQLIDRFRPDKIMSLHAPLGFLDYDGPGEGQKPQALTDTELKAKKLVTAVSEKSGNYRVIDYNFYPGSLGNFAGNERHIPTVTLELESTEPKKLDLYWRQFQPGILQAIRYPFHAKGESSVRDGATASPFSAQYDPNFKKTI
jgi:protein MpaA